MCLVTARDYYLQGVGRSLGLGPGRDVPVRSVSLLPFPGTGEPRVRDWVLRRRAITDPQSVPRAGDCGRRINADRP
eukprot:7565001-Pyramimonas_sp.AAC.1